MTEDTSHLSVDMTTTGTTQITGVNTITSSSSLGIEFYFQCAVVVIRVVGTATNGLVLCALVALRTYINAGSTYHKGNILTIGKLDDGPTQHAD